MNLNFTKVCQSILSSILLQNITIFTLFFFTISPKLTYTQNSNIDALFEKYNSEDSPGVAVSVNKEGNTIYQKGFGMANLEYKIPITTKTKFHVASLSKQFTAFMILKLEDEGLLSLNDDVRKYIPELPEYDHTITINHLLTHSSGLRDQWRLLEMAGWRLDDVIKTEQVFKLITNQKELNFTPGDKFRYSNSGYTLLALIVERVTNTSFANYAKKTIFEPLQMNNSFFYDDHEEMVPNRAYSYKKGDGELIKKSNLNYSTVGPTSLFTTIEDLNKWGNNFKNETIGNKRIFKSMAQRSKDSGFAKGQFVRNYKGFKMIYHSGSDAGYRLYFARFPKLGYQFTVFANASYINAYDEISKLIDYYLQDELPINKDKEESEKLFKYKDDMFISLSNSELKKFEGRYYDNEEKEFWTVELKNDTLNCSGGLLPETIKLLPVGERNFKVKGTAYDISVNFKENDYNEPILEFRVPDYVWLWLEKEVSVDPSDYLGSYYNNEVKAQYDLIKRDNELYLTHQKLDDIKIVPITDSYFMSKNRNFSEIRFQRDNAGKVVTFLVSNDGIESMTFSRE
ncbi:MAG: serine hydrolase domain-containing protein [Bacteroidota bacterium]